jgi:hypothetical protein
MRNEFEPGADDGADIEVDSAAAMKDAFGAAFDEAAGNEGGTPADAGAAPPAGQPAAAAPAAGAPPAFTKHNAPARWHEDAKKAWDALYGYEGAHAHMEAINSQWSRAQAYLTQQEQQRSQLERQWQPIQEMIAPFSQHWAQQGMDTQQGLRQLFGYAQALATNPAETLLQLAEMYGVDLQKQFEDRPYVDPATETLQRKFQELESRLSYQDEHARRAQHMQLSDTVRAFAEAKDASGNLLHPHFEDEGVFNDMLRAVGMGYAQDPETAYNIVVNSRPDIREKIAAQQKAAEDAKAIAAARQKTATVTRIVGASGTVKGNGKGAAPAMSMRDAFEDAHASLSRSR